MPATFSEVYNTLNGLCRYLQGAFDSSFLQSGRSSWKDIVCLSRKTHGFLDFAADVVKPYHVHVHFFIASWHFFNRTEVTEADRSWIINDQPFFCKWLYDHRGLYMEFFVEGWPKQNLRLPARSTGRYDAYAKDVGCLAGFLTGSAGLCLCRLQPHVQVSMVKISNLVLESRCIILQFEAGFFYVQKKFFSMVW